MKTAISLPDDLFAAAEREAERLGMTRSELYRRALEVYLRDDRAVTERLNAVYGDAGVDSRLDPGLRRLQAQSLPADGW